MKGAGFPRVPHDVWAVEFAIMVVHLVEKTQ